MEFNNGQIQRLHELLNNPAIRALDEEQRRKDDDAALTARMTILDELDECDRKLKQFTSEAHSLHEEAFALRSRLVHVEKALADVSSGRANVSGQRVARYRDLRSGHGEQAVIEASIQCESWILGCRRELETLERAPAMLPVPRGPGDFNPPMVANTRTTTRRATVANDLKTALAVLPELRTLAFARLAPRILALRAAELLARGGVRVVHRPQWEALDGSDLLKNPAAGLGPMREGTEIPLYRLPSEAKAIVAAAKLGGSH